jgi:hypothetical protein
MPAPQENKNADTTKPGHLSDEGLGFERVQVIKGVSDIGYTEINLVTDLPSNTQIVTKGAFFVLAKMTNTGEEE